MSIATTSMTITIIIIIINVVVVVLVIIIITTTIITTTITLTNTSLRHYNLSKGIFYFLPQKTPLTPGLLSTSASSPCKHISKQTARTKKAAHTRSHACAPC